MGKTRKGLKYVPQDKHYFEAKKAGFVARSALKLEELDLKNQIFSRGQKVLDLGCAPGSWLQYASKKVGPSGKLLGIDLDPVKVSLANVVTIVGDLSELTAESEILQELRPFDVVQSDAMTKTTGIADSDCARSIALVESGLNLCRNGILKTGGTFVAKVFEGPGFTEFYVSFKKFFHRTLVSKPEATRQGSREVYVIGKGFRPAGPAPKL